MKAAGEAAVSEAESEGLEEPSTVLEKIRGLLGRSLAERTDEVEMTADELTAILDERDTALVEKFAEVVKSVETPEEPVVAEAAKAPETEAPAEVEAPVGLTADDVSKAIQDAFAPYNDILEKVLDRVEGVEEKLGIAARKSLEGQETAEVAETETTKSKDGEIGVVRFALGNRRQAR